MINKVILIGNLGRDPEVRVLESGASVAKFSMATNESYRDSAGEWQTLTEWHNIIMWRGLAERAERSLKKGSLIYLEGKLTHRKWTDQEGRDRYTTEVVANTFRMLDRKDSSTGGYSNNFPSPEDEMKTGALPSSDNDSFVTPEKKEISKEIDDIPADNDDLPF